MNVESVTSIGLDVGNGINLPVIRAAVSDFDHYITVDEARQCMRDVYAKATGCVGICGYYTNNTDAFLPITQGQRQVGSSDGFYVIGAYTDHGSWVEYTMSSSGRGLYYNGGLISRAGVATGYSTYEYGWMIIFTDEGYNLLTFPGETPGGVGVRSEENLGAIAVEGVAASTLTGSGTYVTSVINAWGTPTVSDNIERYIHEEIDPSDEDPYNNPTAGEGVYDDGSSDSIDTPSLPSLSVADTGFITLFNPSTAQLKSLANYLWSDLFSIDTFKKLFADPMSAILGLSILPIAIPSSGSRAVSVGNISTNVSLPVVSQQFLEVNCGSVTVNRQRPGTYLDYSPYTKVEIYLPFIGTHPLNVDDVMNKTVNVKYHVDILSGACTAFVKCGGSILYQFIGSCAISVPINGNDWTNAINGVLNIAGSIGSMVMTGGATAPMAATSIASTVTNNLKPEVEKSGSVSGAGGLMAVKRPYLIITRPNRNVAQDQNKYIGYPTFKTRKLSSLSGYNSIEDVHLDDIPATQGEIEEIKRLLKGGVIF